jgi:C4-dicarboxylate transporter
MQVAVYWTTFNISELIIKKYVPIYLLLFYLYYLVLSVSVGYCRQYSRHNKTTFYLVFDFCEHDLAGLLSNINVKFSLGELQIPEFS